MRLTNALRLFAVSALVASIPFLLPADPAAAAETTTLTDTSQALTVTVPAGMCQAQFDVRGGRGGAGGGPTVNDGTTGGAAGRVFAQVRVSAGLTLTVAVGAAGGTGTVDGTGGVGGVSGGAASGADGGGTSGGGGGGASTVTRSGDTDPLIVAGGGGGGASTNATPATGHGGDAGRDGMWGSGNGGGGGGASWGAGPGGVASGSVTAGQPAVDLVAGAGGKASSAAGGGGGGGGYFAGGGGGSNGTDAGGGGGGGNRAPGGAIANGLASSDSSRVIVDFTPCTDLPPPARVVSVAGDGGGSEPTPGPATASSLDDPTGIDVADDGTFYVVDEDDNYALKVTPAGELSILLGPGREGVPVPGPAASSPIDDPTDVAVDSAGNVYVADEGSNCIVKIDTEGVLSVYAGVCGAYGNPSDGPALSVTFRDPNGLYFDAADNLYICDDSADVIVKVTPAGAATLIAGILNTSGAPTPGLATSSMLSNPNDVAVDSIGNMYIANTGQRQVLKVDPAGILSVFAGSGSGNSDSPVPGPALSSTLYTPMGIEVDADDNVYVSVDARGRIVKITPDGTLSLYAGNGLKGKAVTGRALESPIGAAIRMAMGPTGLYVIDDYDGYVNRITPPVPAAAPTIVSGVPGAGSAEITFTPPADPHGDITSYDVSVDGGAWTNLVTTDGPNATLLGTVDSLEPATTYQVRVRARTGNLPGAASDAEPVTMPAVPPGPPTDLAATPTNGGATLTFEPPTDDGGASITGYQVSTDNGMSWKDIDTTSTGGVVTGTVTGLNNGTTYQVRVRARNSTGPGDESKDVTITPAPVPPGPPTITSVEPGAGSAEITFTPPTDDGGMPVTGYEVSTDGGTTWIELVTAPGDNGTRTGSATGLANGTIYQVQIRAVNSNGGGTASDPQPVRPATVPAVPTGIGATRGDAQATVTFSGPADNGGSAVTGYTATSNPGGLTGTCTASPCTVTGLANGTAYTFTVHATNAAGDSAESDPSEPVTPATVPAAPTDLTGVPAQDSIAVTFTVPDSGGSPITGYEYKTDDGWAPLTATGTGTTRTVIVDGLAPGTAYTIELRAVNAVGGGPAATVSAATVPAAVDTPTAEAGISSATVTWQKATKPNVTGYTVRANLGPAVCTTDSINDTTCVIGAAAGASYTFTVVANSTTGDSVPSAPSNAITPTEPEVPTTAPTDAPVTLTTTDGKLDQVQPKQQITVVGTGFAAHSTVTIIVYSTPIVLGNALTDENGEFTKAVTIPADLAVGTHNLVASGVDPDGNVHQIRMPVTVAAAASRTPLAVTGAPAAQLVIWGLALIGAGLLTVRRTTAGNRRR